jgi:hypothetical protein
MSQPRDDRQDDLFRPPLAEIINLRHPLVRPAEEIDRDFLAVRSVVSGRGRRQYKAARRLRSKSVRSAWPSGSDLRNPMHCGRYRALVTIAGFFVLATLGFFLVRTTSYPTPSQTMNAELDDELFTGTIRTNPDDKRGCREQFFDNRSGKMTMPEPCGLRALNGKRAPAPSNSIDAIRKSFSSRWSPRQRLPQRRPLAAR